MFHFLFQEDMEVVMVEAMAAEVTDMETSERGYCGEFSEAEDLLKIVSGSNCVCPF